MRKNLFLYFLAACLVFVSCQDDKIKDVDIIEEENDDKDKDKDKDEDETPPVYNEDFGFDFDAAYEYAIGQTLVDNINDAISKLEEGDSIIFKSGGYDFQGLPLTISKPIYISGKLPRAINSENVGAYEVLTVFRNLKRLNVNSDNIKIFNLEVSADASTLYVFTDVSHATNGNLYYKGLLFENVIFRNGRVQCFGRNGADVDFVNVSFLNFEQGGYYLNRSERVDSAPKFQFKKCLFKAKEEAINFNVRAMSIDAGNTEYPVVWHQNNSKIDSCLFDGVGVGTGSKVSHIDITNNHFKGYKLSVDMIHIEEYSHHIFIDSNIFEHVSPARGLWIDRELQPCHDITITNNTWIGRYGWIISAHSPYNIVMENNDFSQAWASNPNNKTIDFTYDQSYGELDNFIKYDLPATKIIFRNNSGLNSGKDGIFAYKALKDDNSIQIDYPVGKIEFTPIAEKPKSIIDTSVLYRIKNKGSGDYLHAVSGQLKLQLSPEIKKDNTDIWELTYKYPYYYYLRNIGTNNYMEVYQAYTMGDYNNSDVEPYQYFVEQTDFFNNRTEKPRWYFRKYENEGMIFYAILPGSNERKSRTVQVGKYMELEYALIENKEIVPPKDDSSWELIPVGQ